MHFNLDLKVVSDLEFGAALALEMDFCGGLCETVCVDMR